MNLISSQIKETQIWCVLVCVLKITIFIYIEKETNKNRAYMLSILDC